MIVSGLRGYKNKVERRRLKGENIYRKGKGTLATRTRKKLIRKASWFRKKKRKEKRNIKRFEKKNCKVDKVPDSSTKAKALIFGPYTKDIELAKMMRGRRGS